MGIDKIVSNERIDPKFANFRSQSLIFEIEKILEIFNFLIWTIPEISQALQLKILSNAEILKVVNFLKLFNFENRQFSDIVQFWKSSIFWYCSIFENYQIFKIWQFGNLSKLKKKL